jgi:acetate---CoA ligase (ADP-forming) subunit beta
MNEIIGQAVAAGRKTLSEHESKLVLREYGIPVAAEELVGSAKEAAAVAERIGFPVVMKACGPDITHKTELCLVELNIGGALEAREAYDMLAGRAGGKADGILVQKMVRGARELVAGLARDATFGPCVMFGMGGIMAEAMKDVTFRIAPLERRDARAMLGEINAAGILGPFRGKPAADSDSLCDILIAVGRIGVENPAVREIDINPIIIAPDGSPVAVDSMFSLE